MTSIITKVSFFTVNKFFFQQRIDNFLIKRFKKIPKSKLYKIIRKGHIRINKKRVPVKYKLKLGDLIRIPPLKINYNIKQKEINIKKLNIISKKILYEDKILLIINKPAGISVHGGSGINFNIIDGLKILRPNEKYLELIHRLDRYTSGILMIAKKRSSLRYFHKEFREHSIQKKYLALVHRKCFFQKKIVNLSLLNQNILNKKKMVLINQNGKKSKTIFYTKKSNSLYSLVSIIPCTGRTHQIRVHSAFLKHPIIFDNRYGDKDLDKQIKIKKIKKTLLLHAKKIIFIHPILKKKITIYAPLQKNFKNAIKNLL
ncbi:RluA family pseudouridine synthase [Buchnera aphidicola]|uniref:RluA family pseudouridine synthase n=1 Tax=Buchnera aphidicola TaxID=9 RepID=UPI002238A26D|nr:RluA family pseudouridine synthase [Buchnera aphidicola]MCW5197774.1 RluA family pseudouridine synthase [Buchnera aphidicola (Chaitophorus viminalis)]